MKPRKGYALATILILLAVCMFGAAALVTISILESKISRSQMEGTVAYYATEAGVKDAVWRLNNDSTYRTALAAGNLNVTYTAANQPATGQGFTVTMTTSAQGAGYADIEVVGTSNNGSFIAKRRVQVSVFQGAGTPTIGNNVFLAGGAVTVTNGSSALQVQGGNFFVRGAMTINQATLNAGANEVNVRGNYVANNSTVTAGAIHAANLPPQPADIAVPGYDFTQYNSLPTNRCTAAQYASQTQLRCTAAQLQSLIGSSNNFTFNNAVVYVSNALTMNAWVRNKTLTFNGLLVINGNYTVNGSATNFRMNINDPGSHVSGLVVSGDVNNSNGIWTVNGVYYVSGASTFTNPSAITVNGAVVSGGAVSINTGASFLMNYDSDVAGAVLGTTGSPSAMQVLHWEEEY